MILDVGCGNAKRGSIGVDTRKTEAIDVVADAHYLPFKNGSFWLVVSSHVLEHLGDPEKALLEWLRVARNRVVVTLPWRNGFLSRGSHDSQHKWSFNKAWFGSFGRKHGLRVWTTYQQVFVFPSELKVEIFKKGG
jgi:ubiquinone/menaquinone biosynthesis C-methylase UbiE